MAHPIYAIVLLLLVFGCRENYCAALQELKAKAFIPMPDTSVLLNPERGFYHDAYIFTSSYEPLDLVTLEDFRNTDNVSIILLDYTLDSFVTSDISAIVLNRMTTDFQTLRRAVMKAMIRFAYTQTDGDMNDAALAQLLTHIGQLTPILKANEDVIVSVQAGFIGTWGEWYYSTHYSTPGLGGSYAPTPRQQADRNTITTALLDAVPRSRMLQLRTPSYKQIYCNTTANIGPNEAFNPSFPCSRIGIHNDCFMASENDQGTFENTAQRTWLTNEGLYAINGGESCESNTATDCNGGLTQTAAQRFTYLNLEYHPLVITGWKRNGCFNAISNMMGYRFELIDGTFPASVTAGSTYSAQVTVQNTGVAPLYNSRPVEIILRNRVGGSLTAFPQNQIDLRYWAPGVPVNIELTFNVPVGLSTGTYDVILNLPDASPSLADQPLARILFANDGGVQEFSTRFNVLEQISVVSSG